MVAVFVVVAWCASAVFPPYELLPRASGAALAEESSTAERDGGSSPVAIGPPKTVTYSTPGGQALKLDVWEPAGGGTKAGETVRRPAVIMVHGGGWSAGGRGRMPLWDRWFAGKGYVVFDVDYRLAPQPRWRAAPGDVKCAVGWVKRNAARYGIDPERIALVGHSAGGHLALLSAYSEGDGNVPAGCGVEDAGVSAVAAFYPPTDLTRLNRMKWPWMEPNVVGRRSAKRLLGGAPETLARRYRLASPTAHVDAKSPPTFLVHGGADRVVPVEQSELLGERLRRSRVPHRLLTLPGADHSFDHASASLWNGPEARTTRAALSRFLERHLAKRDSGSPET